jgi:hypothetical protein
MNTPYALGAIPSTPDERDFSLDQLPGYEAPVLPPTYTPKLSWSVLNQGQTPACVGFSAALDTQIRTDLDYSDLAVFDGADAYAHAKKLDGNNSEGTSIRQMINVRLKTGLLAVTGAPPLVAGSREKIGAYARLNNVTDIKSAIVAYGSSWMASDWYNAWFSPHQNGVLPPADQMVGEHAFTFVGYDDTREGGQGAFLMQNSWGAGWALSGRCWFPYSYLTPAIGWEAWRTTTVKPEAFVVPFTDQGPDVKTATINHASDPHYRSDIKFIAEDGSLVEPAPPTFTTLDKGILNGPKANLVGPAHTIVQDGKLLYLLDRNVTLK